MPYHLCKNSLDIVSTQPSIDREVRAEMTTATDINNFSWNPNKNADSSGFVPLLISPTESESGSSSHESENIYSISTADIGVEDLEELV